MKNELSHEIERIELETAKLRMERERLALDAEIRKSSMVMSVRNSIPRVCSGFLKLLKYGIGIYIVLWIGGYIGHQLKLW